MSTFLYPTARYRGAALGLFAMVLPMAMSAASGQKPDYGKPAYGDSPGPGIPASMATVATGQPASAKTSFLDAAVDALGNIYMADSGRNTISKVAPNGTVSTLAGRENVTGSSDGTGTAALFNGPQSVAVDSSGNVYVADANNHTIRKITYAGVVTTLAGSAGMPGNSDGMGADARFRSPQGVAVDSRGNVYVADTKNHIIRRITSLGVVTTLAGAAFPGYADGSSSEAKFYFPTRVALDVGGNVYVADTGNHLIRKVSASGGVTTLAGSLNHQTRSGPEGGYADGTGSAARFNSPEGIKVDATGDVFVSDSGNQVIRKVTGSGVVTTVTTVTGAGGLINSGQLFNREDRFNRRGQRRGDFTSPNNGFGVGTGTFIFGGLPSPGDVDRRFGRFDQGFSNPFDVPGQGRVRLFRVTR